MNPENVLAEFERATRALQAANNLCEDGLNEDAISRSYYAVCMLPRLRYWSTMLLRNRMLPFADHLMERADYSYALFFGHLAVEKVLKALHVVRQQAKSGGREGVFRKAQVVVT